MYDLESTGCYMMPTCGQFRDPKPWDHGGMRYGKVTSLSVSYLTDIEAVSRCLPNPFRPADKPMVSVTLQKCEDVDWLAGRSYNLVGVDVSAVFDGQTDHNVQGAYSIVMWEDMCEPILGGRDHTGVPKIFGDIDFHAISKNQYECRISRFSHQFMNMSVNNLSPLEADECRKIEQNRRTGNWMCYKHFPTLENDGADVSYATIYPSSGQVESAWSGTGEINFMHTTFHQVPTQHDIINLLADLPILEVQSSMLVCWKEVRLLDQRPRRLK